MTISAEVTDTSARRKAPQTMTTASSSSLQQCVLPSASRLSGQVGSNL